MRQVVPSETSRRLDLRAMNLKARDPRSKAEQIADDIREQIKNGEWATGQRLPPTRELMEYYDASSQTIQSATRLLRQEGTIYSNRRGVFVAGPSPESDLPDDYPAQLLAEQLSTVRREVKRLDEIITHLEDRYLDAKPDPDAEPE